MAASRFFGMFPQTEDCEVVALGGTAREYDILTLGSDNGRNLVTGFLNGLLGAGSKLVRAAAGVAELLAHVNQELPLHFRIDRRRCVAIKIYWHCLFVNNFCLLNC